MEAQETNPVEVGDVSLLCLRCRSAGHIMQQCSSDHRAYEFGWFFSPARMSFHVDSGSNASRQELCKRCRDLDIIGLLYEDMPWNSLAEVDQASRDGSELIRSIGHTGSIQFRTSCPVCRCLFAMTPNPSSLTQEVVILPHWTMGRLVGENEDETDMNEKRRYAKCLLVALKPSSLSVSFSRAIHRGDALCITESGMTGNTGTMGGRAITPNSLHTELIEDWLSSCWQLHGPDCKPQYSDQLRYIRLIDVKDRVVVAHPPQPCEYVALSYVWGGEEQKRFQLGSRVKTPPKTIEDAMTCTRILGKRYIWVDAVCIDQLDKKDKELQIGMMWSIYRGAWITIIALSGESASSGLARLGSRPSYPQLACNIDGKSLVGLGPTLTQQIWMSPWGTRAWTLQEALLSPRSLYLSDHQLYFECNAMQCCESLDQRRSWAHNLDCTTDPGDEQRSAWIKSQNGSGCLKNPLDSPSHRLRHWGAKVILYCYRSMTKQEDALKAFNGVLQRLESMYDNGFFWGLPQDDFQWGLLWQAQAHPQRREMFPTWSWAGWRCAIWPGEPKEYTNPNQFPVQLHIQKVVNLCFVDVFKTEVHSSETNPASAIFQHDDALTKAARSVSTDPAFIISRYAENRINGYLFVEAIAVEFSPDYSRPWLRKKRQGEFEIFLFLMRGILCELRLMSTDGEIDGSTRQEGQPMYLLLARDRGKGLFSPSVYHYLLLVYVKDGLAMRGTVMILLIPEDHLELIEDLQPRRRRIVLT